MERMNVVSAVANLQKEMEFYREEYKECREIIKQLTGDPPAGFKYIHPHDVAMFYARTPVSTNVVDRMGVSGDEPPFLTIYGRKYRQSINIPATDKTNFK